MAAMNKNQLDNEEDFDFVHDVEDLSAHEQLKKRHLILQQEYDDLCSMSEKEKADAYSEGWKEGVEEGVKYAEEDRVIRIRREREAAGFPYRYFFMFFVLMMFFSYGVRVVHEIRNNKDFIAKMEAMEESVSSTKHFFDFDDSL